MAGEGEVRWQMYLMKLVTNEMFVEAMGKFKSKVKKQKNVNVEGKASFVKENEESFGVRSGSEKMRCKRIGGEECVPMLVVYDRKVDKKLSLNVVERLLMESL